MLTRFFIKKATLDQIKGILDKEGFIYTDKDAQDLLKGNQKGARYGNVVLPRNENGIQRKRFIKIVLDGTGKTFGLFRRQVQITAALHDDPALKSAGMAVIKSSLGAPVPYAIFETRENGENFGFMHDAPESYAGFTEQEIYQLVEVIYAFHRSGLRIKNSTLKYARHIPSRLALYQNECKKLLGKKILHRHRDGSEVKETVERLLMSYAGMLDIRQRILQLFEKNWKYVGSSIIAKGHYLVHADMQIDNVYKHKDGSFELLDFEWVGKGDNPVIAIMYDYGNLRARAWSSPAFQSLLDKAMREVGIRLYGHADMIGAAMALGIVRSSLLMSRYHLDVVNTLKKDKRTEEQYHEMYAKTIESLVRAIKQETSAT